MIKGKNKKILDDLIRASTAGMTNAADIKRKKDEVTEIFTKAMSSAARSSGMEADSIIEELRKSTTDAGELRKKIIEARKKEFIAREKTTVGKSILLQGLFGNTIGGALSARFAKADPKKVQEAMDFMKSFEKLKKEAGKKKKPAGAAATEDYYDVGIGEGVVQTGGTAQVKRRKTDRLSKMIYADETWEVKATDLLESIIKSTGKFQSRHKPDKHGNIHEKLTWIIENCCDKCCDNGLPIPVPLPTRIPGRGRVPTTVPARVPVQTGVRTRVPAGALTEAQIAAYERSQTGVGALAGQRTKARAPVAETLALGYEKSKVKLSDIIGEERVKVPVSPSRMEQMRRAAIDAETPVETTVKPSARKSMFSDLKDELSALKDDVVKATEEVKRTGGTTSTGAPVKPIPSQGEYIPAQRGGVQVSKMIQPVAPSVRTTATPAIPKPGSLVGGIGGIVGSIAGYMGLNELRDKEFKGKSKEQLRAQADQLAEQAKQNNLTKKEVDNLNKQVSAQKKDIANRGAVLVGSAGAGSVAAKLTPKFWTGFLKFLATRNPALYARFGARIAASVAGLSIPGPGWIWSAINVLGAAWAAYEIWGLIEEYNALPAEQKVQFEKEMPAAGPAPAAKPTETKPPTGTAASSSPPPVKTESAPSAATSTPKESSYQGTISGFYAAAYKDEIKAEQDRLIKQGWSKDTAREVAEMNVKEKIIKGELPLKGGATLSGVQKETTYDIDKRGPTSAIPSDALGLPGSQMSRDTNVIDRGRTATSAPKPAAGTQGTAAGRMAAARERHYSRMASMGMSGAPPTVSPTKPAPEKGFFEKAYSTISSAASGAFSSVKSFLGFGGDGEKKASAGDLEKYVKKADSSVDLAGLDPKMKERLAGLAKEYNEQTGQMLQVNSGYRSPEKQAELYEKFGPPRAAPPGKSRHESGLAIDINSADANRADALGLMAKYGFTRPVAGEAWHVEPNETAKRGGTPDNPFSPGAPVVVASKSGA